MNKTVHLVEVLNPLDPRDRTISPTPWVDGMTVAQLVPFVMGARNKAISVNGLIIEYSAQAQFLLKDGDYVVVCPIPEGGAKNILRLVATIGLSIIAPYAAGALMGAGWVAATGIVGGLLTAGIMVVGGMVINALLPPPKPKTNKQDQESPTYGADGAKNTAAEGIPVPVIYGTYRAAGNILSSYVVNEESRQRIDNKNVKTTQQQYLYMLVNMGEGPIQSITNIQLNDQPIENFTHRPPGLSDSAADLPGYEIGPIYLGTDTQGPSIQWFSKNITPRAQQTKLTTTFANFTTIGEVDRLRIDLVAQSGLFKVNAKGNYDEVSVQIEIQYRLLGSGTWLQLAGFLGNADAEESIVPRSFTVTSPVYGSTVPTNTLSYVVTGAERRDGLTLKSTVNNPTYGITEGTIVADIVPASVIGVTGLFTIKSKQRNAWRSSITSNTLTEGRYELRYRRTAVASTDPATSDEIFISDVNEISNESVGHRNTALLPLKILMTDKLNGAPNVTALVQGRIVPTFNESSGTWVNSHSSNPAWIALDALTHRRYGGGSPVARFDILKWREWAKFCETKALEFNGVFDQAGTVWDATQTIFRVGRAQLVPSGTRFTVAIEKPEDPVMMFSVANMAEGSFKINWLPMTDRANEVELTFQDKDDNYRQRTIKAVDQTSITLGSNQRTAQVTMPGVTSLTKAWDEAHLMLNMNRYITNSVEFSAPAEAIACTVGDVVLVQHDMPAWGYGGRLDPANTTTVLKLDRPVQMTFGKTYQALVHFDSVVKLTGTVSSVVGNAIYLNGFTGFSSGFVARRLVVGSKEMRIDGTIAGSPAAVVVDSSTGVVAGNTFTLYNTDELVTRTVTNPTTGGAPDAEVTQLTLTAALPSAPAQFDNWMFGETNKVAKPFRVRAIGGDDAVNRTIMAVEYNATIYDPAGALPTPGYSRVYTVDHAVILDVRETLKQIGTSFKPLVTIVFGPATPRSRYSRSEVLAAVGTNSYQSLGFFSSEASVDANVGELIRFKVIARDDEDRPADSGTAPQTTYRVEGETTVPGVVTGEAYSFDEGGLLISWNPAPSVAWNLTIVRKGSTWATAETVFAAKDVKVLLDYFSAVGAYRYLLRHDLTTNTPTTDTTLDVVVTAPAAGVLTYVEDSSGSVKLTWGNLRTSQPLKSIEVRVGPVFASAAPYGVFPGDADAATLIFTGAGTRKLWVQAEDMGGIFGAASSVDAVVTGSASADTTPPPNPVGFAATSRFGTNYLSWTPAGYTVGGGHAETVIYAATYSGTGPVPILADAVAIGSTPGPGNGYADPSPPGTIRYYWITHKTKAGIIGPFTGGAVSPNGLVVTTVGLLTADIDNQVITAAKFASSIEPVTLVTSVPGVFSTKLVFNSTDGKVYRWNGSAYVATMPTSDLLGTISAGQIAAGAISADKIAAGAITSKSLVLTDFTNLVSNPSGNQASTISADGWSAMTAGKTSVWGTSDYWLFQTATESFFGDWFPVQTGDQFFLEMTSRPNSGTTGDFQVNFGMVFRPDAASATGEAFVAGVTRTTGLSGNQVSAPGFVTVPASQNWARISMRLAGSSAGYYLKNIQVRRKNAGELIVDGTIVGAHIAAGTITANKINSNGLDIKDAAGNVIFSSGSGVSFSTRFGANTTNLPANNATVGATIGSNLSGSFNSGNIGTFMAANTLSTTYIADAAITNAKILDGTILSAKIGNLQVKSANIEDLTVGTTKITGNAVTNTVSAFTAASTGGISANTIVQTIAITSTGGRLIIWGGCNLSLPTSASTGVVSGSIVLKRGATILATATCSAYVPAFTSVSISVAIPVYSETLAPGTYTYTLESPASVPGVSNRGLAVTETKK